MFVQDFFTDYLIFNLINYLFSILTWTLIGRFALFFFIGDNRSNYIYKFFCLLTDWFLLKLLDPITPRFMSYALLPLYGLFFVILIRIVFWIVAHNLGWSPQNVVE